jgi:hypothetical protein
MNLAEFPRESRTSSGKITRKIIFFKLLFAFNHVSFVFKQTVKGTGLEDKSEAFCVLFAQIE